MPVAHRGLRIGPYTLSHLLGRGGMAEVWRVTHARWPLPLALKLLTAHTRSGLRDEVRAVAALDHPNVVQVMDVGRTELGGRVLPWLVMELGRDTLAQHKGELGWPQVHDLLRQVLAGLAHAHAHGVVHRDLKPANVLAVGDQPIWKLADFGIAALLEDEGADDGSTTGTPRYMAPEQILGRWRDQGPWTDLYALGCVVHELVSWAHPFAGMSAQEAAHRQVSEGLPPLDVVLDAPPGLDAWVGRLSARDPARRFRRAGEALAALDALAPGAPPPVPRAPRVWLPGGGLGLVGLRSLPLVGRDAEQAALREAVDAVCATGAPRVIAFTGPAGVGKSALARALTVEVDAAARMHVLRGTHARVATPMDGLAGVVLRDLRCTGLTPDGVRTRLARLLPPDLAVPLSQVVDPASRAPAAQRFAAMRAWLGSLDRPLLLWLDDVQWGAEALAFLKWLERTAPLPLLVVLTAQTEALADAPHAARALDAVASDVRRLGPLDTIARSLLVRSLLGLAPALAAEVAERSGGNPLFAVQLVAHMVQRGVLEPRPGGFALVAGAEPILPAALTDVWAERLEALIGDDVHTEQALVVAAALGTRIRRSEWDAACAAAGVTPPADLVDRVHAAGLAVPEDDGWAFVHGMLREAIVGRARGAGTWSGCCGAVARVVPAHEPGRLAALLLDADRAADAIRPLLLHAVRLSQAGRPAAALAALDRRNAALDGLGVAAGTRERIEGDVTRARLLSALGRADEARGLATAAVDQAVAGGWRDLEGDACNALGVCWRVLGDADASRRVLAQGLLAFRAVADPIGVARAQALLADLWQGHPAPMITQLLGTLPALRERDEAGALYANMLTRLANLHWMAGDDDQAARLYQEVVDRYRALGNRNLQGQCVVALAAIAWRRGDLDGSQVLLEQASALLDPLGMPRPNAGLKVSWGSLARARDDLVGAERYAREAIRILHDAGVRNRCEGELLLALVLLQTGRRAELAPVVSRLRRRFSGLASPDQLVLFALLAAGVADSARAFDAALGEARALVEGPAAFHRVDHETPWMLDELDAHAERRGWSTDALDALRAALG